MSLTEQDANQPHQGGFFRTTHWSVVLEARSHWSHQSSAALETLCRAYWQPVYLYIRSKGHSVPDAQDLTQSFFEKLLEKNFLDTADSAKGRFRTFLLTAVGRFLINQWDRQNTQKRGGGKVALFTDVFESAEWVEPLLPDSRSPDRIYEQEWASSVLRQVLGRLRSEFDTAGSAGRFDELKAFLMDPKGEVSYADAAQRLGMTVPAVRSSIFRLRQRYRDLLRQEIANTVSSPSEVDDEVRHLLSVLSE